MGTNTHSLQKPQKAQFCFSSPERAKHEAAQRLDTRTPRRSHHTTVAAAGFTQDISKTTAERRGLLCQATTKAPETAGPAGL